MKYLDIQKCPPWPNYSGVINVNTGEVSIKDIRQKEQMLTDSKYIYKCILMHPEQEMLSQTNQDHKGGKNIWMTFLRYNKASHEYELFIQSIQKELMTALIRKKVHKAKVTVQRFHIRNHKDSHFFWCWARCTGVSNHLSHISQVYPSSCFLIWWICNEFNVWYTASHSEQSKVFHCGGARARASQLT